MINCFIPTEVCSCTLKLAYLREKYLKIDWSVKMPLHWLIVELELDLACNGDSCGGISFTFEKTPA